MRYDPELPWRDLTYGGFNHHIGPMRVVRAGENEWQGTIQLDERHRNAGGVCHGGATMTLADVTMGTASFESGGRRPCATIEMSTHFLAAAKLDQRILAVATQMRLVRDLSFMSCEVWGLGPADEARLVMRASGIWKFLASREPNDPRDRRSGI